MARRRHESPVLTIMLFALLVAGIAASLLDPAGIVVRDDMAVELTSLSGASLVLFIVGMGMIVVGGTIRLVAIATLKENFSGALRIREGHTLIKNGIYGKVRHPAYLGAILFFLGLPIMLSSPVGFAVMVLLVPVLLHRIDLEERMLIGRFGAEYEDYMRSSKRLIPFLY